MERQPAIPSGNEDFCRFASILGPEKFLTVLNYVRPQIEDILNAWVLAVERLYEVFLEVTSRNQPDSAYERYAEATQPLGFEGVEALENITGSLMSRAGEAVLKGVKA